MYPVATLLLLQSLGAITALADAKPDNVNHGAVTTSAAIIALADIEVADIAKRAATTYAGLCTFYNTITVAIPPITSLTSSSCTSFTTSGTYATVNCYTGVLVNTCSPAVTATSCATSTVTSVTTKAVGGTSTSIYPTQTCSNAIYPPTPLQTAPGTTCYADNINNQGRVLSGASTTSSTMTNAFCKTYCTNLGFAYSGTEYSSECYCGNNLPVVASSFCNMACSTPGSFEICGGPNALSVSVNSAIAASNSQAAAVYATWTSQGCYGDNYPSVNRLSYKY